MNFYILNAHSLRTVKILLTVKKCLYDSNYWIGILKGPILNDSVVALVLEVQHELLCTFYFSNT